MQRAIMATIAACLLACPFSTPALVAQPAGDPAHPDGVSFVPRLTVGQAMAYDAEWAVSIAQSTEQGEGVRGQAQRITTKAELRLEIVELGPDGRARVRASVPTVSLTHRAGDESREYQHPLPPDTAVIAVAWSGLGEILSRAAITFEVDAAGRVSRVAGLEQFVNTAREASPDLDLTGLFSPTQFVALVQPIFTADGARNEKRAMGTSWESTQTTPLGAAGVIDITETWRFVTVADGVATVVGTPALSLRRPANPTPTTPRVAIGDNTGYTRIAWNVDRGMLQARDSMLRMSTTFAAGDVAIEQTQTTNTKLTAKAN